MNHTLYSNYSNRSQSSVCKSNNTSVSSILRDSSSKRPKKQHSVRFEDSPTEKTITIKLSEIYTSLKSPSPELKSPSHSYFNVPKNNQGLSNTSRNFSPAKPSPVKAVCIQHSANESFSINEPRFVPKVMNYTFRNQNFYDKLSRFYHNSEGNQKTGTRKNRESEKDNPKTGFDEDKKTLKNKFDLVQTYPENSVIQLKPCLKNESPAKGKSPSPVKDAKQITQKKLKNIYGQNILN